MIVKGNYKIYNGPELSIKQLINTYKVCDKEFGDQETGSLLSNALIYFKYRKGFFYISTLDDKFVGYYYYCFLNDKGYNKLLEGKRDYELKVNDFIKPKKGIFHHLLVPTVLVKKEYRNLSTLNLIYNLMNDNILTEYNNHVYIDSVLAYAVTSAGNHLCKIAYFNLVRKIDDLVSLYEFKIANLKNSKRTIHQEIVKYYSEI